MENWEDNIQTESVHYPSITLDLKQVHHIPRFFIINHNSSLLWPLWSALNGIVLIR
jgi:hypothetical protein